ncbi:MAG TPA: hypothetical protein VFK02_14295 [Kofleriaceae bacterium]|nr:hypothetical protein [Kofleriaceae bacterium]
MKARACTTADDSTSAPRPAAGHCRSECRFVERAAGAYRPDGQHLTGRGKVTPPTGSPGVIAAMHEMRIVHRHWIDRVQGRVRRDLGFNGSRPRRHRG